MQFHPQQHYLHPNNVKSAKPFFHSRSTQLQQRLTSSHSCLVHSASARKKISSAVLSLLSFPRELHVRVLKKSEGERPCASSRYSHLRQYWRCEVTRARIQTYAHTYTHVHTYTHTLPTTDLSRQPPPTLRFLWWMDL